MSKVTNAGAPSAPVEGAIRPLSEETRRAVDKVVADLGEAQAAALLGVSLTTLWRGLAGRALQPSTRFAIEHALGRHGGTP